MLWRSGRKSDNVEDRRGFPASRGVIGGGIGAVVLVIVALMLGVDPGVIFQNAPTSGPSLSVPQGGPRQNDELADFASVVLGDTEDTWHALFRSRGAAYQEPTLVLFTGAVQSACGFAQAAMGPFYCPLDHKVYIDLAFFQDLKSRFGAPGDFAQAYVIAHEVGHHVQTLLGITKQVHERRSRVSPSEANRLSVRLELQADCLAGVWAHHAHKTRQILETGDVEEALRAASMIGDDRLQRQSQGYVVPDSFTHGSSEQRVRWFRRGIQGGDLNQCNTFTTDRL